MSTRDERRRDNGRYAGDGQENPVPMWRIRYFDERRARWVTDFTGLYSTESDASAAKRVAEMIWPDVDHEVVCV